MYTHKLYVIYHTACVKTLYGLQMSDINAPIDINPE